MGHITLVYKFQHRFQPTKSFDDRVFQNFGYDSRNKIINLDYNGAGVRKPLCREPYPPERFAKRAVDLGIPLVVWFRCPSG